MPALDDRLQPLFSDVFLRMVRDARATSKPTKAGVSEVDWIENFHALVAENLETELGARIAGTGLRLSASVGTALVHGSPFQVSPVWGYRSSPTVELGDLLLVGERHDATGLIERQALLLQMKIGAVALRSPSVSGPTRQAALFAEWPPFTWAQAATLSGAPGPFPRTPAPGPCDAAQFGIIPDAGTWGRGGTFDALPLSPGPRFESARPLVGEMARAVRLALNVDATPGPANGWARIVQDVLDVAQVGTFRAKTRTPARNGATTQHRTGAGGRRGRFVVVVVGFGDQGVVD
jgi:hypothetical protein